MMLLKLLLLMVVCSRRLNEVRITL